MSSHKQTQNKSLTRCAAVDDFSHKMQRLLSLLPLSPTLQHDVQQAVAKFLYSQAKIDDGKGEGVKISLLTQMVWGLVFKLPPLCVLPRCEC
jgi:hypothetical protein